jgi:hypothetical protein
MPDYEMDSTEATADEQDLAVWLCQSIENDASAGRWKLYLRQAKLMLAFRAWETKQN